MAGCSQGPWRRERVARFTKHKLATVPRKGENGRRWHWNVEAESVRLSALLLRWTRRKPKLVVTVGHAHSLPCPSGRGRSLTRIQRLAVCKDAPGRHWTPRRPQPERLGERVRLAQHSQPELGATHMLMPESKHKKDSSRIHLITTNSRLARRFAVALAGPFPARCPALARARRRRRRRRARARCARPGCDRS